MDSPGGGFFSFIIKDVRLMSLREAVMDESTTLKAGLLGSRVFPLITDVYLERKKRNE